MFYIGLVPHTKERAYTACLEAGKNSVEWGIKMKSVSIMCFNHLIRLAVQEGFKGCKNVNSSIF
jgi:hypothetical protein